jgi:chromosome segregation ATPase
MRTNFVWLLSISISLLASGQKAAHADASTEAQLRAALQTATTQIASLEDQVANLQAAQAPNVATIEALRAQLKTLQANGSPAAKPAPDPEQAKKLAALQVALSRSQAAYQSASSSEAEATENNKALQAQLAQAQSGLSNCRVKNQKLYSLADQILNAYSHKDDFFGTVANREPFIGFSRVQLQNIVQDDQDKLLDNQIVPGKTASPAPGDQ